MHTSITELYRHVVIAKGKNVNVVSWAGRKMKLKFSITTISSTANSDCRGKIYGCIVLALIDILIPWLRQHKGPDSIICFQVASKSRYLQNSEIRRLHKTSQHICIYHATTDSLQLMWMCYTSTGLPGLLST